MCGIVGLFLKDDRLQPELGALLSDMLISMTDRGPDSAGVAIYGPAEAGMTKITVQSDRPAADFPVLEAALADQAVRIAPHDSHAVIRVPDALAARIAARLPEIAPGARLRGQGAAIEIYKETGLPAQVVDRFGLRRMAGTHATGHTRMATESAVTTDGAHPFSTGPDECLVHNGSLSNHNNLRRAMQRDGVRFATENDSEVAAAYLTHRMAQGDDLKTALERALRELDGFYTFVVGTRDGFGVLRDPIACKPAVMAETDAYVAFGSEYRALVGLPGIDTARVWEPEPATVYFWRRA